MRTTEIIGLMFYVDTISSDKQVRMILTAFFMVPKAIADMGNGD
jgi:hypothetical protein